MTDKSHVSMESKVCPICGHTHQHDCRILLDSTLKDSLERETVTGFSLCEDCQKHSDNGMLALVEIDPSKSELTSTEDPDITIAKAENVHRTGTVVLIPLALAKDLFKSSEAIKSPLIYIDAGGLDEVLYVLGTDRDSILNEKDIPQDPNPTIN